MIAEDINVTITEPEAVNVQIAELEAINVQIMEAEPIKVVFTEGIISIIAGQIIDGGVW